MTDLDDLANFAEKVKELGFECTEEELELIQTDLQTCFLNVDETKLFGIAKQLYDLSSNDKWWCFASLRMRALKTELKCWKRLFKGYDLICVDEAQDLSRSMFLLCQELHKEHCFVYTLDGAQKLYRFMKCINVQDELHPDSYKLHQFYITYRHGQTICDYVMQNQLQSHAVYSATTAPKTVIERYDNNLLYPGEHTVIMTSWKNILLYAEKALAEGRAVRIDETKRLEIIEALESKKDHSRYAALFTALSKHWIKDVVSRMNSTEADDEIFLTTIHGSKGLQWKIVRLFMDVVDCKRQPKDDFDDSKERKYVAVTRCQHKLVIPMQKTLKRKSE